MVLRCPLEDRNLQMEITSFTFPLHKTYLYIMDKQIVTNSSDIIRRIIFFILLNIKYML